MLFVTEVSLDGVKNIVLNLLTCLSVDQIYTGRPVKKDSPNTTVHPSVQYLFSQSGLISKNQTVRYWGQTYNKNDGDSSIKSSTCLNAL